MPYRTELEWAKEICQRQGYFVVPKYFVHELSVTHAVGWEASEVYGNDPRFREHVRASMLHQLAHAIEEKHLTLKDGRREISYDRPPLMVYSRLEKGILDEHQFEMKPDYKTVLRTSITVIEPK